MNKKVTGAALALTVAALFAAGNMASADHHEKDKGKVKCSGVNGCKGKGDCGVKGKHSCQGKNECKGKGWNFRSSEKECTDKGGTVVKEMKGKA